MRDAVCHDVYLLVGGSRLTWMLEREYRRRHLPIVASLPLHKRSHW